MATDIVARRKAERKKWARKFPREKMLWFGGVLYFVDRNDNPEAPVPRAKILAMPGKGHGLGLARKKPESPHFRSSFSDRRESASSYSYGRRRRW